MQSEAAAKQNAAKSIVVPPTVAHVSKKPRALSITAGHAATIGAYQHHQGAFTASAGHLHTSSGHQSAAALALAAHAHAMSLPTALGGAELEALRAAIELHNANAAAGGSTTPGGTGSGHARTTSESWAIDSKAWASLMAPPNTRSRQPSLPRTNKFELDLYVPRLVYLPGGAVAVAVVLIPALRLFVCCRVVVLQYTAS